MPNAVKYKTGNLTGSLQKGNVALGISGSLGPTSTTGWYNGPNPVAGKYQIFETAISGDPEVYSPQDDAELIKFARWKGVTGVNTGSAAAVLAWIGTQTNLMAANFEYESIVTNGLVLNLDAGFVGSYPTINTTWYDLSGNTNNGTLINGPTFNSANSGSIVFDGVDDIVSFPAITLGSTFTISQTLVASAAYNNIGYMPIGGGHVVSGSTYRGYVWFQTNNDATNPVGATVALVFNQDGEAGGFSFGLPTSIPRYTLFQYTLVKNGSTAYFYINGSLITTQSVESARNFTVRNLGWSYSSYYMNRNLYSTQIYNRSLSSTEVLQNFNAQKGRFGL